MNKGVLRLGIVLECATAAAWVAKVVEDLQSSEFAELSAVILVSTSAEPAKRSLRASMQEHWRFSLFRLYEGWDYRRNKAAHDALAPRDLSDLLMGVPAFAARPDSGILPDEQLAEMQERKLDVILSFSPSPLSGLADAARFGLWSIRFDQDDHNARRNPAMFWRIFDRNPVSPCVVQVDRAGERRIAYEGYAATDPASLYRTRNPAYWKIAEAAVRALRKLHLGGAEYMDSLAASEVQPGTASRRKRTLNSFSMAAFMGHELVRWCRARATSLQASAPPKWCIGIRCRTAGRRFDDPSGYTLMASPADRFYADPFLFEHDGKTFLFFEDFRYPEGRAVISCCVLAADGTPSSPYEVLRRPYHLSYPFLFVDEGEIYMIPETRGNRAVELYRATDFPRAWIGEGDLLSGIDAVDSTIQRIEGRLWMFTGVSNGNYSNSDELAIFSSDSLRGPWKPHPQNPVVSDVQRARPAGMLFYESSRLIRPSQDCGKAYGYALVFSEILRLTETEYEERLVGRIMPERIPHAISNHTYNRTERFEVVDRTLPARIADARGGHDSLEQIS